MDDLNMNLAVCIALGINTRYAPLGEFLAAGLEQEFVSLSVEQQVDVGVRTGGRRALQRSQLFGLGGQVGPAFGQPMLRLHPDPYRIALEQTEAALATPLGLHHVRGRGRSHAGDP